LRRAKATMSRMEASSSTIRMRLCTLGPMGFAYDANIAAVQCYVAMTQCEI
jgi:hypothetical protein